MLLAVGRFSVSMLAAPLRLKSVPAVPVAKVTVGPLREPGLIVVMEGGAVLGPKTLAMAFSCTETSMLAPLTKIGLVELEKHTCIGVGFAFGPMSTGALQTVKTYEALLGRLMEKLPDAVIATGDEKN